MRRCRFFFNVFGLELPDYLSCHQFSDSNNPDICVGQKQMRDSYTRALKPGKHYEYKRMKCIYKSSSALFIYLYLKPRKKRNISPLVSVKMRNGIYVHFSSSLHQLRSKHKRCFYYTHFQSEERKKIIIFLKTQNVHFSKPKKKKVQIIAHFLKKLIFQRCYFVFVAIDIIVVVAVLSFVHVTFFSSLALFLKCVSQTKNIV